MLAFNVPIFFIAYIALIYCAVRVKASGFLLLLSLFITTRFLLASLHLYTYPEIMLGFSINSLFSLLSTLVLFYLSKKIYFLSRYLIPLYLFMFVIIVSSLVNQTIGGLFTGLLKWVLLVEIVVLCYLSLIVDGKRNVMKLLCIPFLAVLVAQYISFVLGIAKNTEDSLGKSYIGGFYHEAVFSVMLLTGLIVTLMAFSVSQSRYKYYWIILGAFYLFGIYIANYRTAMVATFVFILYFAYKLISRSSTGFKLGLSGLALICIGLLMLIQVVFQYERFEDINSILSGEIQLFKYPEHYTVQEGKILSGRVVMWASYIDQFNGFNIIGKIIGRGAESWKLYFGKHAHNSFVSYIFEYGVFGLISFIYIMFYFGFMASRSINSVCLNVVSGGYIGFWILCLGTLPFWQIEGIFLFSIATACIIYAHAETDEDDLTDEDDFTDQDYLTD